MSIDRDCHDEELTGFVLEANKKFVVMSLYTNDDEFDGWGNREHDAIKALIGNGDTIAMNKLKSTVLNNAILEINTDFSSLNIYTFNNRSVWYFQT